MSAVAVGNSQVNRIVADASQSFVLGFVANNVVIGLARGAAEMTLGHGLIGGAISTLASLVDSATRQILAQLFSADFHNSRLELLTRTVVVLTVLAAAVPTLLSMMGMSTGYDISSFIFCRCIWGMIYGPGMLDHQVHII